MPFLTIQKAASVATAGDVVYIREGTYNEKVICYNSGTADAYITYRNYPGETAVIDGDGISVVGNGRSLFDTYAKSYIIIDGLNVINSGYFGIGCFKILPLIRFSITVDPQKTL